MDQEMELAKNGLDPILWSFGPAPEVRRRSAGGPPKVRRRSERACRIHLEGVSRLALELALAATEVAR
jgi:hypothetical protein